MARYLNRLNQEINFFNGDEIKENYMVGWNGITTGFYVIVPENIESLTPEMQIFRMNCLQRAINAISEEFSMRWYCLQSPFDFSYEENRLKIIQETDTNDYIKKTAEVYRGAYKVITDENNDMRKRHYVMAISSSYGASRIKNFFERISGFFDKAGCKSCVFYL